MKAEQKRRNEDRSAAPTDDEDDDEPAPDAKKGKQKNVYGNLESRDSFSLYSLSSRCCEL